MSYLKHFPSYIRVGLVKDFVIIRDGKEIPYEGALRLYRQQYFGDLLNEDSRTDFETPVLKTMLNAICKTGDVIALTYGGRLYCHVYKHN